MRAVTLVKLPNTPKFLGCFDNNYDSWWYSNPLPGSVDEIVDSTWAYGQYHICFAKMLDNTYSIFQSKDYGVNWVQVLNFSYTIYTIIRIDYGRLLCSTSNGIYESTNAGTTWSKISSQTGLVTIKEVGDDKLVGITSSGNCLYSSNGITWTSASTLTSTGITITSSTSTNCRKDCIDGQNGIVLNIQYYGASTSIDCYMGYSQDYGHSYFTGYPSGHYWGNNTVVHWNSNNSFMTYGLGWINNGYRYSGPITKIICTGMRSNGFPTFVIQQKLNGTNTLRHYYAYMVVPSEAPQYAYYYFVARFDALESTATDLSAKEILSVGTGTYQRTVVFTGANTDGTPRVVTSPDGGYTWINQDVTSATIYSGPDMSQEIGIGGAFLEDSYISTMWTGPVCHNSGSWNSSGYLQMGISYEMDFLTRLAVSREQSYSMDIYNLVPHIKTFHQDILFQKPSTKSYVFDALFRSPELFTYSMDVLNQKANLKQYSMDVLNQKANLKQYTSDVLNMHFWTELYALDEWVQKVCLEQFDMDIISVFHFTETFLMDSLLQKVCIKNLIMDVLQEGLNNHSYSMDIKIQDTIVGDILHNTERYHWQGAAIGIGYPRSSYPIFDSRKETKT